MQLLVTGQCNIQVLATVQCATHISYCLVQYNY
jgi:hypothetical protein